MKKLMAAVVLVAGSGAALGADPLPHPSMDHPCLYVSEKGWNSFRPNDVEHADFCAPGGAEIQTVYISDVDAWVISQPWRTDEPGPFLPDRLAMARKREAVGSTSMTIQTTKGMYFINIGADQPGASER
jgi:hypothetical protein